LLVAAALACTAPLRHLAADEDREFRFGLTPVLQTDDLELLDRLRSYLEQNLDRPVRLVTRRTYQEITSLLVSGQLHAAWICGYPYVQYRDQLSLVAVPIWKGRPLYQSYLIVTSGRDVAALEDLRGDIHAFSDPDSNSGYLVTATLLAERGLRPDAFFSRPFFTYGHRNVVRAVGSGLAQSGSVDGYVWEVMSSTEPGLTDATTILHKSQWLGFPPIACPQAIGDSEPIARFTAALTGMRRTETGRQLLDLLKLDGFETSADSLFDTIATQVDTVRRLG
jgi:phosphonate transport system substrate-binding protein